MARKPAELRPVMTRLPEALRHRLEGAAKASGRSMNGELIHRLEDSFKKEESKKQADTLIEDMAKLFAQQIVGLSQGQLFQEEAFEQRVMGIMKKHEGKDLTK